MHRREGFGLRIVDIVRVVGLVLAQLWWGWPLWTAVPWRQGLGLSCVNWN